MLWRRDGGAQRLRCGCRHHLRWHVEDRRSGQRIQTRPRRRLHHDESAWRSYGPASLGIIGFIVVQSVTNIFGHDLAATSGALIFDQRAFWVPTLAAMGAGPLAPDRILASMGVRLPRGQGKNAA